MYCPVNTDSEINILNRQSIYNIQVIIIYYFLLSPLGLRTTVSGEVGKLRHHHADHKTHEHRRT